MVIFKVYWKQGLWFAQGASSFFLASLISPVVASRLGKRSLPVAAALVSLGYVLVLLAAWFLVPLWGMPPFLFALFVLGFGMGSLSAPLLSKTLEGAAHHDAGAASGVYTTVSQIAGAFGVTLIGLLDASLTTGSGNPLRAFVISLFVIALLSLGLSLSVLPLAGSLPPTTARESLSTSKKK